MKLTLLDMVQDILSDMDSDEVNSIDDTIEAGQVSQIIKTTYFEMIGTRNWPHLRSLAGLNNSTDVGKPNYLRLPADIKELEFIRYNHEKLTEPGRLFYTDVKFLYPDDFLYKVSQRNNLDDNVDTVTDFSGIVFPIFNDKHPNYWTSFDDGWIVFDSYNKEHGVTLQSANCQAMCYFSPTWNTRDDFVPDLPDEAFPTLLEEAKSTAFFTLKQMANQKAEQRAARGHRWLSRKAWQANGGIRYPDYGRKRSNYSQPLHK